MDISCGSGNSKVIADAVLRRGSHVQVMEDMQDLLRREHCQLFLVMRLLWQHIMTPMQGAFVSVKLFPIHPSVRHATSRAAPSVVSGALPVLHFPAELLACLLLCNRGRDAGYADTKAGHKLELLAAYSM